MELYLFTIFEEKGERGEIVTGLIGGRINLQDFFFPLTKIIRGGMVTSAASSAIQSIRTS